MIVFIVNCLVDWHGILCVLLCGVATEGGSFGVSYGSFFFFWFCLLLGKREDGVDVPLLLQ